MEFVTLVNRHPMVMVLACLALALPGLISLPGWFSCRRQNRLLRSQLQHLHDSLQVERERLEKVVSQRTAQLSELTHHLLNAREDERNRLARNLHDELGALLTSAKLDAARIKSRLSGKAPEALELLAHLVETLNSSIALGRTIIEDLRPSTLGNLGLVATLEILAREFAAHSGVAVQCSLQPVKLAPGAELMIYRLVQEAITNITKYAQASHVFLHLALTDDRLEVWVRDDGVGFDTSLLRPSAYGLLGMRFRVEAEGGRFSVESAPGQGTRIQASLPTQLAATQP
jgi:signal transduction histidine kinase